MAAALRAAPEPLQCFKVVVQGRAALDLLMTTLLEDSAPLDVRTEVEALMVSFNSFTPFISLLLYIFNYIIIVVV